MRTITELQKAIVKELSEFYYFFRKINYASLFMVIFAFIFMLIFIYFSFKIPLLISIAFLSSIVVAYLIKYHIKLKNYWKRFDKVSRKLDSYSDYFFKVEIINNLSSFLNDFLLKENIEKNFEEMLENVLFSNENFINLLKEFDNIIKEFIEKELDDFSNGDFEYKFASNYSSYIRLYSKYIVYYENYLRKIDKAKDNS